MVQQHEKQTEGQKLLKQLRDEYGKPQLPTRGHSSESGQALAATESYLEPSLPIQ